MECNKILHLMTSEPSILVKYYRWYCEKSQDYKVFLNFKLILKQLTFFNFSQLIIKVNLHRLLVTYQKYFDFDLIISRKIQNIIKKYNKIISKISFINNFTNLKFYNFFALSSVFGCIQEKVIVPVWKLPKFCPITSLAPTWKIIIWLQHGQCLGCGMKPTLILVQ